ncbi:hypothetical protein BFW38_06510 [Terasakiispira papahanaumokuakeensis]|uniref:diguanylate cyclase n=1 Tax=Terasakiispira papahanaumokuakeensis TaxID=197479 RepID=A0A1E2V8D2_9GAMM|nr:GGDEF domain-containing protein [Terasakiispira papahanaumokuakeensis]ODC03247.1 hypothetical protein BFW38_06510 [Terasakiispira papahanaumokuakeensis]
MAETQAELERLASTDPLTGCINRRAMEALLRNEYERFQRYQAPFTVAILDYDHFKLINDHYGHEAGDEALRTFARLSQQVFRVTDCVARWGGEEFLVLMPNTQRGEAEPALQRLRQVLNQTGVHYRGHDLSVTVSIGARQCDELLAWDRLVNQADQALYYAKETGRDRLVFFQDIP